MTRKNTKSIAPLEDFTIIVGWDESWGWVTLNNKVYIWGDRFRQEIFKVSHQLKLQYKRSNI